MMEEESSLGKQGKEGSLEDMLKTNGSHLLWEISQGEDPKEEKGRREEPKQQRDWRWRQKMSQKPKGHQSLQIAKSPLQPWNID